MEIVRPISNIYMNLNQIVWLDFEYMNKHYEAEAIPAFRSPNNALVPAFDIYFDNEYSGTIIKDSNHWVLNNYMDNDLLKIIRNKLFPFFRADLKE